MIAMNLKFETREVEERNAHIPPSYTSVSSVKMFDDKSIILLESLSGRMKAHFLVSLAT